MRSHQANTDPAQRGGMAPVEFCMALPILLVLMVGITWLGFSVIGQTEVLVEARNKAWKRRFEDAAKKPLMFPSGVGVATNPFYSAEADYVTEESSKTVNVSPVFNGVPGPNASHTILAGSWDHRAMPFDKPPEWELLAVAAANGTTGNIQTWLSKLKDPIGQIKDLGSSILASNSQQSSEIESNSKSGAASAKGGNSESEQNRAADKAKLEQRRQEIGGRVLFNGQIVVQGGELKETDDELSRLRTDRLRKLTEVADEPDEEKKQEKQAELDRINRRIDLLKGKRERLESELRDVEAELKALS